MRITSPKNVPLQSSQANRFSRESKFPQKDTQLGLNTREAFHSHHNSKYSSKLTQQYALNTKGSIVTDTFVSLHSARSRSKHQGISMSRDKTIKVDNIYEPQHFGQNKNSQNYSTKSITTASNRNTKSISRLTRATSPTITTYPQRKQSQYTTNGNTTSLGTSIKQLNQSYGQDTFDFKDLRKELNKTNNYQQQNLISLPQNQDYYGLNNQLTENRQSQLKNKQFRTYDNQFYPSSDYNMDHKTLHRIGSKAKGLRPSIVQKQPSISSQDHSFQYQQVQQQRDRSPSSFFQLCANTQSHKLINSQKNITSMKPSSPSVNNKLGWRDVIKK